MLWVFGVSRRESESKHPMRAHTLCPGSVTVTLPCSVMPVHYTVVMIMRHVIFGACWPQGSLPHLLITGTCQVGPPAQTVTLDRSYVMACMCTLVRHLLRRAAWPDHVCINAHDSQLGLFICSPTAPCRALHASRTAMFGANMQPMQDPM